MIESAWQTVPPENNCLATCEDLDGDFETGHWYGFGLFQHKDGNGARLLTQDEIRRYLPIPDPGEDSDTDHYIPRADSDGGGCTDSICPSAGVRSEMDALCRDSGEALKACSDLSDRLDCIVAALRSALKPWEAGNEDE